MKETPVQEREYGIEANARYWATSGFKIGNDTHFVVIYDHPPILLSCNDTEPFYYIYLGINNPYIYSQLTSLEYLGR